MRFWLTWPTLRVPIPAMGQWRASRRRYCILAEIRAISLEELRGLRLFPSEYSGHSYWRLEPSVGDSTFGWSLTAQRTRKLISRRLDDGDLDTMDELYGPLDSLAFVAALEEQELVGLATWRFEKWNRTVWLWDIRVAPNHRRKGTGTSLLQSVLWEAMRLKARGVMLETQNLNYSAILFYLGNGFTPVGLNTELYGVSGSPSEVALFFFRSLS